VTKHPSIVLFFVASLFLVSGAAAGQSDAKHKPVQYGPTPSDLANALVQMARNSQVPVVAELVWPLPQVSAGESNPLTEQTLNQLVKQAPDYEWRMNGKVLHFYNKKLRAARFNFLNFNFPRFTVPSNLSEFKLWFPTRAIGLLQGYTDEGAAISGFPDAMFQKHPLQTVTLSDVSALEVLLHVANETPVFYTVLTFPSASPTKDDAEKRVNWQWGGLKEESKPIYAQPLGVR
jgi:hypothetical protein